MKLALLISSLLLTSQAWSQESIVGISCQDYWDEFQIAGDLNVFMDPIKFSALDTVFMKDLLNPKGEPPGIERGAIFMNITRNSCTYSRTGTVLVTCRANDAINGTLSYRYLKLLGENQTELVNIDRSMGVRNLKLELVVKDAPNEDGRVIAQPVMEISFTAHVADGRVVNYKYERPFGEIGQDNYPGMNWGRRCSFITDGKSRH